MIKLIMFIQGLLQGIVTNPEPGVIKIFFTDSVVWFTERELLMGLGRDLIILVVLIVLIVKLVKRVMG